MTTKIFVAVLSMGISISIAAQNKISLVVKADQPKAAIEPTMWGVFFEDINFAADGGIYAELVKNRSFEFAQPLMGKASPVLKLTFSIAKWAAWS